MARLRLRRPLLLIVLAAFGITVLYVLRIHQYFVQPDELEYVEQALRIGQHLHPILPSDRDFTSWSQLQPVLMAPAWTLLSANRAFDVQHVINAALMVSAAIPAYLLALRVAGSRRAAYVVALLTVIVPWIAMAATMLTEVAAYPAFLWGMLGVQHAVTRPSGRADLLALGGMALAISARPQFVALAPALVVAVVAQELRYPSGRHGVERRRRLAGAVRAHPVLAPVTVLAGLGLLVGAVGSRHGVLGTYSVAAGGSVLPPGTWAMGREALDYVAVAVGVLPLGLSIAFALASVWRPADPERHAYAWLMTVVVTGLVLAVGSFSVRFTGGINSRYVFFAAPLLFVGMVALLTERRRMPVALLAGGAAMTWLVAPAELALRGPSLVSPDAAFHDVLFGRLPQLEERLGLRGFPPPRVLAFVALLALVAMVLARRRGRGRAAALVAVAGITAWCAVETGYGLKRIADTQRGASAAFLDTRSWIDGTLPAGATAPMLISSFGDPGSAPGAWWDVHFWNKKVDRVLQLPGRPIYEQPFPEFVTAVPDGSFVGAGQSAGALPGSGPGVDSPWLVRSVIDRRFGFAGASVLGERNGVQVLRLAQPVRLDWQLLAPEDTGALPAGSAAELRVFGPARRRRLAVVLSALPGGAGGDVRLSGSGFATRRRVRPDHPVTVRFGVPVPSGAYAAIQIAATGRAAAQGKPPAGVQVTGVRTGPA